MAASSQKWLDFKQMQSFLFKKFEMLFIITKGFLLLDS